MATLDGLYRSYVGFIHRTGDKFRIRHPKFILLRQLIAETFGTFLLILFGDGSGAQKFLSQDRLSHFLFVSLSWGVAVTIAIMVTGQLCPAIFNPAIAVSNAVVGCLRWVYVPLYILAEFIGAYIGAGILLAIYNEKIINYANVFDNGQFLVNTTGGIFVASKGSSVESAVFDQIITTAAMVILISAVTDMRMIKKPGYYSPFLVGAVVYVTVGTYSANASSALNPARDFGPRLLLLSTYWGAPAFTQDNYYFWLPLLMPIIGAVLGALIYEFFIGIHLREPTNTDQLKLGRARLHTGQLLLLASSVDANHRSCTRCTHL